MRTNAEQHIAAAEAHDMAARAHEERRTTAKMQSRMARTASFSIPGNEPRPTKAANNAIDEAYHAADARNEGEGRAADAAHDRAAQHHRKAAAEHRKAAASEATVRHQKASEAYRQTIRGAHSDAEADAAWDRAVAAQRDMEATLGSIRRAAK